MTRADERMEDSEAAAAIETINEERSPSYGTVYRQSAEYIATDTGNPEEQGLFRPRTKSTVPIDVFGVLLILLLG